MKNCAQLLFIVTLLIISSCRKDKTPKGLEPIGNVLIMQLNGDYDIEGTAELSLDVNLNNNQLDLVLYSDPNEPPIQRMLQFSTSLDTLLHFRDGVLIHPILSADRIEPRDGRFFSEIDTDDFVPNFESKFDAEKLLPKIGDSRLLHGYFDTSSGEKITVIQAVLNVVDEELDLSMPTVKYFLLAGL